MDIQFLPFLAVRKWFYHILTAPHVLSGVVPLFIIINKFSAGEVAGCLAVFCYLISNNKSQQ